MKTVTVMQPYFFPYLGYYQLASASSTFVFLDDVTFIKGGWINRNRILLHDKAHMFTVPLSAPSSFRHIAETSISAHQEWRSGFRQLLEQAYSRAPFFTPAFELIEQIVSIPHQTISSLAAESVRSVCDYVGVKTNWQTSSSSHPKKDLKGAARIVDICHSLSAERYVNAPGGKELYTAGEFKEHGIELRFLRPVLPRYSQHGTGFIEGLSIIDVLMFNPPEQVRAFMDSYELE
jgi:hypothetical protein